MSTTSFSLVNTNPLRKDKLAIHPLQSSKIQSAATNSTALPKPKLNASVNKRGRKKKVDASLLPQPSCKETTMQENIIPDAQLVVGVKGISSRGRVIRSPHQFWKGNDTTQEHMNSFKEKAESFVQTTSVNDSKKKKIDLNESMTLRNKKVIEKKKSPKETMNNRKNTPLIEVNKVRETHKSQKKPLPVNKSEANKEEKENSSRQKGRPQKKKDQSKENSPTLEKGTKTLKQKKVARKEPTEKKVRKRRNEEKPESEMDSCKKKKVDEISHPSFEDEYSEDDDLFGIVSKYTKSFKSGNIVLSPNAGMMSIKKDAVASFSKETPPCKAVGQLMSQSGVSAPSTSKEVLAKKPNHVVKRVGKVLKRNVSKCVSKQSGKEPATSKVIPTTTPLTTGNLISAVLGNVSTSDESDFENDDDSDLQ